jgi:hypothetical protein
MKSVRWQREYFNFRFSLPHLSLEGGRRGMIRLLSQQVGNLEVPGLTESHVPMEAEMGSGQAGIDERWVIYHGGKLRIDQHYPYSVLSRVAPRDWPPLLQIQIVSHGSNFVCGNFGQISSRDRSALVSQAAGPPPD